MAVLSLVRCFIWFSVLNRGFAIGPVPGYVLSTRTLVDEGNFFKRVVLDALIILSFRRISVSTTG
jgi:hypothetical protein